MVKATQDPASASPELVDFIVDRIVPNVRAVRLGGVAYTEELTSRTFNQFMDRMVPLAGRLGTFELITSLSMMSTRRANLLARCLTEVQISLEAIGDNFTRLRGFPWSTLVNNVGMLVAARSANPESRMKITLVLCAMSDMLEDLLRLDVFKSLGADRLILRELTPRSEKHLPHVLYNDPEKARAFVREFSRRAREAQIETAINIATRYDPPEPHDGLGNEGSPGGQADEGSAPSPATCAMPFETLTVVHTGQFGVCDFITDLAAPLANLSAANIMDVWNAPRFRALRAAVNSSSPPPMCLSCEIKVGDLNEAEREVCRARSKRERTIPAASDDWSTSMGGRYINLNWLSHSNSDRRESTLRARAEEAEARAQELARLLVERDQTIAAMTRTRAWRLAARWGGVKRAVRNLMGNRRSLP
jgi:hypothetical protein